MIVQLRKMYSIKIKKEKLINKSETKLNTHDTRKMLVQSHGVLKGLFDQFNYMPWYELEQGKSCQGVNACQVH